MVAEQLVNIVQSDLSELRQVGVRETTIRLRLENELSDTKVGVCACVILTLNLTPYSMLWKMRVKL